MGIRVHKAVGYGCRGFLPSEDVASRLRESQDLVLVLLGPLGDVPNVRLILPVAKSVSKGFAEAKMLDMSISMWEKPKNFPTVARSIYDCRIWDDEFGVKDAILFLPPESALNWKRYDDYIDYHEETGGRAKKQVDYFKRLKCGLYPYRRGEVPLAVGAVLLYSGLGDLWPRLQESLYVYWS